MFFLRNYLPDDINLDFVKYRYIGLALSIVLVIVSLLGLATKGLNYGIDFKGGVLIEARFKGAPDLSLIRGKLNSLGIGEVTIQTAGKENDVLIKSGSSDGASLMKNAELIKSTIQAQIDKDAEFRKVEYVGAEVGEEMVFDGAIAVLLTFIAIMIYVWIRFDWQYSIGIIAGLLHDLILTIGFLIFTKFECNITSIAAILTILGYSVNDTVVIYDRIRENLYKIRKKIFPEILNQSINETIYRTLFTLLTTLISAGALVLFGGEALRSFSITVFVGITIGTYSSIFISIPVLNFFGKSILRK